MPAVPLNGPDGSAASNTSCFNYDGSLSPDVFCDLEGKDTCCGAGWDCLTNGLCRQSGTTSYAQGTCLNKAFDRCLSFCNQPQFEGFTEVSSCGQQEDNSWCCAGVQGQQAGGGQDCCNTDATTLQPFPFVAIINHAGGDRSTASVFGLAIASSTALGTTIVQSPDALIQAPTSSASDGQIQAPTLSTSRRTDATSTSTADTGTTYSTPPPTAIAVTPMSTRSTSTNGLASPNTASAPAPSPSSSPTITPAPNQSSDSRGIIIGISAGGGLFFLIVLTSLIFLYLKLKSVKRKSEEPSPRSKLSVAESLSDQPIARHLHGYPPRELEGNIVRELDGQMINELDGTNYQELPDGTEEAQE